METVTQQGFSWEEAEKIAKRAEDTFNRKEVETILGRYADDIEIRFAGLPEIKGKAAAEKYLRARFARENNYKVKKTLFMVQGFKIGATFSGYWDDVKTGKHMISQGVEVWQYRDGKLILQVVAMSIWEKGTDLTAEFL